MRGVIVMRELLQGRIQPSSGSSSLRGSMSWRSYSANIGIVFSRPPLWVLREDCSFSSEPYTVLPSMVEEIVLNCSLGPRPQSALR